MLVETRPIFSRSEFDHYLSHVESGRMLTGESFIHTSQVMNIEGWNLYGNRGNLLLTEPQQVLLMWSDLVGQVENGGFEQFVYNYQSTLKLAYELIAKIEWPDLFKRFDRAFREQAGDPQNPLPVRAKSWDSAVQAQAALREKMLDALARRNSRWKPWRRGTERAFYAQLSDVILKTLFNKALEAGEVEPIPYAPPISTNHSNRQADAFDQWFYLESTRLASKSYLAAFISTHSDKLCRIED